MQATTRMLSRSTATSGSRCQYPDCNRSLDPCAMSLTTNSETMVVVKLIAQGSSHRFQYGYWHLEPLVAVLRDSILAVACIYAAVDAVNGLASGGHDVEYGLAAL